MTTTAFETEKKPGGVSESCIYSEHENCRSPNCQCSCHAPPPNKAEIEAKAGIGPENACPTCGVKRPANELFCRIDGTRLTSLACNMCGRGMNPEDHYCFNCGAPKGEVKIIKVPQLVVPGGEIEYENVVLKGLQEELSVQVDATNNQPGQVVTEQPAGPQGSFKLVSQPSPNKVRGPVSPAGQPRQVTKQPIRPSIRLPIKPA